MKLMKYITGCSAALLLLAGCNKEEGPNIDDYFLNYEIPEIPMSLSPKIIRLAFSTTKGMILPPGRTVIPTSPAGSF